MFFFSSPTIPPHTIYSLLISWRSALSPVLSLLLYFPLLPLFFTPNCLLNSPWPFAPVNPYLLSSRSTTSLLHFSSPLPRPPSLCFLWQHRLPSVSPLDAQHALYPCRQSTLPSPSIWLLSTLPRSEAGRRSVIAHRPDTCHSEDIVWEHRRDRVCVCKGVFVCA